MTVIITMIIILTIIILDKCKTTKNGYNELFLWIRIKGWKYRPHAILHVPEDGLE